MRVKREETGGDQGEQGKHGGVKVGNLAKIRLSYDESIE